LNQTKVFDYESKCNPTQADLNALRHSGIAQMEHTN